MVDAWIAPVALSKKEIRLLALCKKQKLWAFLRRNRHLLLDSEVRNALESMYTNRGRPPVAPERMALALLLQVGFGVADHEVPVLTMVDQRWKMVLDVGEELDAPLFSQGTVFNFRERARTNGLMALLLDKTVALARESKGFSHKRLRAIFDSSPLVGAGRVEDTFNLLGRAISELLEAAAQQEDLDARTLAEELEVTVFTASSVKAVLDVDWREPKARAEALQMLLDQFTRLRLWLEERLGDQLEQPPLVEHLETVELLIEQDTEPDTDPPGTDPPRRRLREGVSKDRIVSLSDKDMRHGRKTKTKPFSGYKRHVAVDADVAGLICSVVVQPANRREQDAVAPLFAGLDAAGYELEELHVDRGYIPSPELQAQRRVGLPVISKPPSPQRRGYFTKWDFEIDFTERTVTCPNSAVAVITPAGNVTFRKKTCASCPIRDSCTPSPNRKLKLHPSEQWHREMAQELSTPKGRALRRERIPAEHTLARVSALQGNRARYLGLDKNIFDLQRTAVVNNLFVLDRLWAEAA